MSVCTTPQAIMRTVVEAGIDVLKDDTATQTRFDKIVEAAEIRKDRRLNSTIATLADCDSTTVGRCRAGTFIPNKVLAAKLIDAVNTLTALKLTVSHAWDITTLRDPRAKSDE